MGLRLIFLSWWTPKYVIRRELANVSDRTNSALQSLLSSYVHQESATTQTEQKPKNVEEQRAIMAKTHTRLVEALEAAVGHDKAVKLGREALFSVGQELGRQTRRKLGVGNNPKDLTRAAKILYRVLGITFHLEWLDNSNATATIDQCALAEQYSKLTCEVLSATDEGVINGLLPNVTMQFKKYMTSGCKSCKASLHFNVMEKKP
jgi:hypothetical protein